MMATKQNISSQRLVIQETYMESLTPEEKVLALLNSFNTGDQDPIAYINPNKYIQHNLAVADGLAGFAEAMKTAPPQGFSAWRFLKDRSSCPQHVCKFNP